VSDPSLQTPPASPACKVDGAAIKRWLSTPVTVTFSGWVFAATGLAALILLLIALD
jgi:hypothetical protein